MVAIGKIKNIGQYDGLKCWYVLAVVLSLFDIVGRGFLSRLPFISVLSALSPIFVLICVIKTINRKSKTGFSDVSNKSLLCVFLAYNLVIIIRGFIQCEDYWDVKDVFTKFGALIMPAVIFAGFRPNLYHAIFRYLITWYVLATLLLCGHEFFPVQGLPLLFVIPWLFLLKRNKWYWLLVVFVFFSIYGNFDSRGWIIRVFFALGLAVVYKYFHIKEYVYKLFYVLMISLPLLFVALGYWGKFNVFAMDEYIDSNDEEMTADTRTELYTRVYQTLDEEDCELFGKGAKSEYWSGFNDSLEMFKDLRKKGRSSTESGLLNFYLMGGWIGGLLYSLLFWCASYLAMFKSSSQLCRFLGMFVLFRWVISFIDEPQAWFLNYMMLFMGVSMCMSRYFRSLNDVELISWIKSFYKKA